VLELLLAASDPAEHQNYSRCGYNERDSDDRFLGHAAFLAIPRPAEERRPDEGHTE